jgi:hypothetical protein
MSEGSDNGARVRLVDEGEAGLLARISERYHAARRIDSDAVVDLGTRSTSGLPVVGATGFEPATFRPPAERIQVSMCLGASVVSYVSRAVDDLDR